MVAWLTLFKRGNDDAVVVQNRRPLVVKKNDAIAVDYEHVLSVARTWWGNKSDFDLAVGISTEEMWPVANSQDLVDMLGAAEELLEEQGGGGQISVFAKEKPRGLENTTVIMKCPAADARAGGRAIVASLTDDAASIDDDDDDAGATRAAEELTQMQKRVRGLENQARRLYGCCMERGSDGKLHETETLNVKVVLEDGSLASSATLGDDDVLYAKCNVAGCPCKSKISSSIKQAIGRHMDTKHQGLCQAGKVVSGASKLFAAACTEKALQKKNVLALTEIYEREQSNF